MMANDGFLLVAHAHFELKHDRILCECGNCIQVGYLIDIGRNLVGHLFRFS